MALPKVWHGLKGTLHGGLQQGTTVRQRGRGVEGGTARGHDQPRAAAAASGRRRQPAGGDGGGARAAALRARGASVHLQRDCWHSPRRSRLVRAAWEQASAGGSGRSGRRAQPGPGKWVHTDNQRQPAAAMTHDIHAQQPWRRRRRLAAAGASARAFTSLLCMLCAPHLLPAPPAPYLVRLPACLPHTPSPHFPPNMVPRLACQPTRLSLSAIKQSCSPAPLSACAPATDQWLQ